MIKRPIVTAAVVLALFGLAGSTLVSVIHHYTKDQIAANERAILLEQLDAVIPADALDNNFLQDKLTVSEPQLLGVEETIAYLGFKEGQPVAIFFSPVIAQGYNGSIKLLVAIYHDGTLGGVRVLAHKETPGLGDKIDLSRSEWMHSFDRRSLKNPQERYWKVKKFGGEFDQFSGATITPSAIIQATKNTLIYYDQAGKSLFTRFQQQNASPESAPEETAHESD